MEVLYLDHPIKIRQAHIDCPEKRRSQPYGQKPRSPVRFMFRTVGGYTGPKIRPLQKIDRGSCYNKKQVVNQEMLKLGMAGILKNTLEICYMLS